MGKHNVSRVKYLPSKVFYTLWHNANKYKNKMEYIHAYSSVLSSNRIKYTKFGIDIDEFYDILSSIYIMKQISINDLIKHSKLSRAKFGYKYCIPIRTLEEWCKNDTAPDYLKLLIIKQEKLFKLPKYIHISD